MSVLDRKEKVDCKTDRFNYTKGDIKFVESQCKLCKFNNFKQFKVCSKYPNGKSKEIIINEIKCSYFTLKD